MLSLDLLLPVTCGLLLSFVVERGLRPMPRAVWRRPLSATAIHSGIWLIFFAAELALFRRPWFAMAMVQALLLLMVLVSNAKFHSLREPFVFQDFEYFTDALKHPRLYLPFLGWARALAAAFVFVAVVALGMALEAPMVTGQGFVLQLVVLVAVGAGLRGLGALQRQALSFEPEADLERLGFVAALWHYGRVERRDALPASPFGRSIAPDLTGQILPTLVAVQSESFFDARRLSGLIRPEVLAGFDRCCKASLAWGNLDVPAWGANTVRTEFAFLSGLSASQLGVHRFNPYRHLRDAETASLARYLKQLGYRTVCVHPYPADFYRRKVVYPRLGFDQFIDLAGFSEDQKFGPYIGDLALADTVGALLDAAQASGQPLFIYVITMENHGPLHLEKIKPAEAAGFFTRAIAPGTNDLAVYLRHLANADRMLTRLTDKLESLPAAAGLCWFGDHVPIMPEVYLALGLPDAHTDYLLWQNAAGRASCAADETLPVRRPMRAEELGQAFLSAMGLIAGRPASRPQASP